MSVHFRRESVPGDAYFGILSEMGEERSIVENEIPGKKRRNYPSTIQTGNGKYLRSSVEKQSPFSKEDLTCDAIW